MTIEEMRRRKRELGLTNEDISERTGLSVPTVQRILSGTTKNPQSWTRALIESVLSGNEEDLYVREKPGFKYAAKKQGEYTIEDYLGFPDERRCEIIDGVVYDLSSPTAVHQEIAGEIFYQLKDHVRKNKGPCRVFIAPLDSALEENTIVQPDVMIQCDPERKDLIGNPLPDLVAEVVSPSSKKNDYLLKLEKYKNSGVREYWIVDHKRGTVTVYLLDEDFDIKTYDFFDKIPVSIWDGKCEIDLSTIKDEISLYQEPDK